MVSHQWPLKHKAQVGRWLRCYWPPLVPAFLLNSMAYVSGRCDLHPLNTTWERFRFRFNESVLLTALLCGAFAADDPYKATPWLNLWALYAYCFHVCWARMLPTPYGAVLTYFSLPLFYLLHKLRRRRRDAHEEPATPESHDEASEQLGPAAAAAAASIRSGVKEVKKSVKDGPENLGNVTATAASFSAETHQLQGVNGAPAREVTEVAFLAEGEKFALKKISCMEGVQVASSFEAAEREAKDKLARPATKSKNTKKRTQVAEAAEQKLKRKAIARRKKTSQIARPKDMGPVQCWAIGVLHSDDDTVAVGLEERRGARLSAGRHRAKEKNIWRAYQTGHHSEQKGSICLEKEALSQPTELHEESAGCLVGPRDAPFCGSVRSYDVTSSRRFGLKVPAEWLHLAQLCEQEVFLWSFGDTWRQEMSWYTMKLIREQWVEPFIDTSKWEYFDLSCKSRDDTNDKVLHDAVASGKRLGAIFKEPTITPTTEQVKEFGLKKPFGSPNGAMRRTPWLGFERPVYFERHAVGGEYGASWKAVGKGKVLTTYWPEDEKDKPVIIDGRVLHDDESAVVVYDNPLDNVGDLAHIFFQRCLEANIVPYVVTKKILRMQICRSLIL
eukprot:g8977.t1